MTVCVLFATKRDLAREPLGGSAEGASGSGENVVGAGRRKGHCKWFNVAKGWGFITPEDGGQDTFVHQSVIAMAGFRSLGEGELVEFECKTSEKGLEATYVTGPAGADCVGSQRRPPIKKRFRKIRCYNCGEFANHIAAKCNLGPQPKRCHQCKSSQHLIADCPTRNKDEESEGSRTKPTADDSTSKKTSEDNDTPSTPEDNSNNSTNNKDKE